MLHLSPLLSVLTGFPLFKALSGFKLVSPETSSYGLKRETKAGAEMPLSLIKKDSIVLDILVLSLSAVPFGILAKLDFETIFELYLFFVIVLATLYASGYIIEILCRSVKKWVFLKNLKKKKGLKKPLKK